MINPELPITRLVQTIRNRKVYIRTTGSLWEYLLVIDNELYTWCVVLPRKWKLWKKTGDYTEEEIKAACAYMLSLAETTIITVEQNKLPPQK